MKFPIFVVLWLIPAFSLMALNVMPAIFVADEAILIAAFAIVIYFKTGIEMWG